MSEELDVNKIAAEFVTHNIEKFYSTGKDVIKGATAEIRLHLSRSYKDYLECVTTRYSKAKSFFIRNEPTHLYDFYIPLGISSEKRNINVPSINAISTVNPFAIITGGGGSGKSMLMRHLLLDAVVNKEKVPIFLELRELNQTEQSLLEFIKETLHSNRFTLDDEYIDRAMKAGHFAFLFDGFDEVPLSLRKVVRKQLFQLAKNYDKNSIFVSSRQDNEFSGWESFNVFRINALALEQAVKLIEKLPFDSDIKTKFLKDLQGGLFEKHESFLSNPLLLSIMLLTYGESADIPNKLSIFYSQAYATLFQRHDALKAGFQRERLTKLDIQDFGRVFSAFSAHTLDRRLFQMSETQALEYLERAKKIVGISFDSSDYLKDAEQAVCLLVEEGLMITFSHRSFQEYFVAKFICDSKPEVQQRLIDKYSKNLERDNVIHLLYELRPELVEQTFIIPALTKLQQSIGVKKKVGITHFVRYLKNQYTNLELKSTDLSATINMNANFIFLVSFTLKNCGHLIGWNEFSSTYLEAFRVELLKKYGELKVDTSKLSYRDELVRDIAFSNGYFSIKTLEDIFRIRSVLIERQKLADKSLDELLGN